MCFAYGSKPAIVPIAGAAVDTEDLVLRAADGNSLQAVAAYAQEPLGPAVVVMPDVRGLYPFYEELAIRLAERGYDALAIDYFGRTAGVGKRGEQFEFRPHVDQTTVAGVAADVAAAVAHLRNPEAHHGGPADRAVFTIGFCFGGSHSWLQSGSGLDLAGVIGFYGQPMNFRFGGPEDAPLRRAASFRTPLLGLMGGADPAIPPEDVAQFDEALTAAGLEHELVSYPGAPHSFFDRTAEEHAETSADAWERVLAFIAAHS